MKERFFTPKSLARVAEHVEWEDELVAYKDGTTNQEQYMKAMAILWERWMREWSIPDFASAVEEARSGNFLAGLDRILGSLEERVFQLLGFYKGLWAGANPRLLGLNPWQTTPPQAPPPSSQTAQARLRRFFDILSAITDDYRRRTP